MLFRSSEKCILTGWLVDSTRSYKTRMLATRRPGTLESNVVHGPFDVGASVEHPHDVRRASLAWQQGRQPAQGKARRRQRTARGAAVLNGRNNVLTYYF